MPHSLALAWMGKRARCKSSQICIFVMICTQHLVLSDVRSRASSLCLVRRAPFSHGGAQQEQAADGFGRGRQRGSGEWRWRRGDGEGSHAHCVSLRLRGGRGRGDRGDKFDDDTSLSIYRGTMPQDISSEDEDHHLVESLNTRNHVIDHKDATELEKVVKNTILEAKYEDGTLPNPRYMNLTAEEERQLELDELLWFAAEHNELDLALQALKDGANVSSRNSAYLNQTAMHCAAQFQTGHPDMLELLARHGGDVNARNCYNSTPLHEAAYWAYGPAVKKLLELGADVFVLNARSLTPLLNAEGNWAAVARPCVALTEISNASMFIWEHETKGGWRHRLRDPEQRKEVVDMLKEAMGNRSYGRGADPYCGGVDFPDEWEDWDEEAEHYNPLSRPREFKSSLPPCRSPLEEKVHKHEWNCAFENDIQKEIDSLWQRDKWRYYQRFPDEPMSGEEIGQGSESSDSGKDEGRLITRFDSHGPAAQNYDAALLNDGFGDDEGPMMDDDGEDAEGAPQQPK